MTVSPAATNRGTFHLAVTTIIVMSLSMFVGGVAGFVYGHAPQREALTVTTALPVTDPAAAIAGTVIEVTSGRLVIEAGGKRTELRLPADAIVEDIRALPPESLTPGTVVNVGGERSEFGLALTGVVALEPQR